MRNCVLALVVAGVAGAEDADACQIMLQDLEGALQLWDGREHVPTNAVLTMGFAFDAPDSSATLVAEGRPPVDVDITQEGGITRLTPRALLAPNTRYTVVLSRKSSEGLEVAFTTGDGPDEFAPDAGCS